MGSKVNVKSGGQECPPHRGRGIDGAFQPLSTTIVQTIAEFADTYTVRIWGDAPL
jgi:hypothetical protein